MFFLLSLPLKYKPQYEKKTKLLPFFLCCKLFSFLIYPILFGMINVLMDARCVCNLCYRLLKLSLFVFVCVVISQIKPLQVEQDCLHGLFSVVSYSRIVLKIIGHIHTLRLRLGNCLDCCCRNITVCLSQTYFPTTLLCKKKQIILNPLTY